MRIREREREAPTARDTEHRQAPAPAASPQPLTAEGVLALQRHAGNAAVQRVLARAETTEAPPAQSAGGLGDWLFAPTEGEKHDTGASPGTVWQWLTWAGIGMADLLAEVVEACGFEDYEISADFLRHYMSGRGADFELQVPVDWQQKIAKERKRTGKHRDVSAYGWNIPDMKNSLGHFDLEIEPIAGGGKLYTITDRYQFPAFVDGKAVHHGFELDFFGKLPAEVRQTTNDALALLGEWKHPDGTLEKFEIKMLGGKWTFILPQQWLVDSGVDFNVHGTFLVLADGSPAGAAEGDDEGWW